MVVPVKVTSPISVAITAAPVLSNSIFPVPASNVISSERLAPPVVPAMVGAILIFPPPLPVSMVKSAVSLKTIWPVPPSWKVTLESVV